MCFGQNFTPRADNQGVAISLAAITMCRIERVRSHSIQFQWLARAVNMPMGGTANRGKGGWHGQNMRHHGPIADINAQGKS